jgi:hypothetical protein
MNSTDEMDIHSAELSEYMASLDYREGFDAGEAHALYWLQTFIEDGLTFEEALNKYTKRSES